MTVPDGLPKDFTGDMDHMELGNTGLRPHGSGFLDADGEWWEQSEDGEKLINVDGKEITFGDKE